jgi:RNA 3'-terminal phosphate cyclase
LLTCGAVAVQGKAKPSPGYGIILVAETTEGRFLAAERTVSGAALLEARSTQRTAADAGEEAACLLLDEVERCALCCPDVDM